MSPLESIRRGRGLHETVPGQIYNRKNYRARRWDGQRRRAITTKEEDMDRLPQRIAPRIDPMDDTDTGVNALKFALGAVAVLTFVMALLWEVLL